MAVDNEIFPYIQPCYQNGEFDGYFIIWGPGDPEEGGYSSEYHSVAGWDRDSLYRKCVELIQETQYYEECGYPDWAFTHLKK